MTGPELRARVGTAVALSLLLPGLGHIWVARRTRAGLLALLLVEGLFAASLAMTGGAVLDLGFWLHLGRTRLLFLQLPEFANFVGLQCAALFVQSVEMGGRSPVELPWRDLGYSLSAFTGVLSGAVAAHAASSVLVAAHGGSRGLTTPGRAALATFLLPGLGHWLTGRRFKALWFGGWLLGLLCLGLALGDFADFDRARHPYYFAGQALGGVPTLLAYLLVAPRHLTSVPVFLDHGLLYTTCAGLFTMIVAIDAYRRAESDLEKATR